VKKLKRTYAKYFEEPVVAEELPEAPASEAG
jgi:hypothetical protein